MVEAKKQRKEEKNVKKDNLDDKNINDLDYLDWIFNREWARVKKGGFG